MAYATSMTSVCLSVCLCSRSTTNIVEMDTIEFVAEKKDRFNGKSLELDFRESLQKRV